MLKIPSDNKQKGKGKNCGKKRTRRLGGNQTKKTKQYIEEIQNDLFLRDLQDIQNGLNPSPPIFGEVIGSHIEDEEDESIPSTPEESILPRSPHHPKYIENTTNYTLRYFFSFIISDRRLCEFVMIASDILNTYLKKPTIPNNECQILYNISKQMVDDIRMILIDLILGNDIKESIAIHDNISHQYILLVVYILINDKINKLPIKRDDANQKLAHIFYMNGWSEILLFFALQPIYAINCTRSFFEKTILVDAQATLVYILAEYNDDLLSKAIHLYNTIDLEIQYLFGNCIREYFKNVDILTTLLGMYEHSDMSLHKYLLEE